MSTINATRPIQELLQAGKTLSEICIILKARFSRTGVYKVLKSLKETGFTLPKVWSTSSCRERTQKFTEISLCDGLGWGDFNWLKSHLFFKRCVKVNQHVHLKMLKGKLVRWINATCGEDGITFQ